MIRGVGVDLVELERIAAALGRHGERLVRRLCTEAERRWIGAAATPARRLAVAFAVKEAAMKALGTGMRGVGWHDIDATAPVEGPVERLLSGRGLGVARRRRVERYAVSVGDDGGLVVATVLLSGAGPAPEEEGGD